MQVLELLFPVEQTLVSHVLFKADLLSPFLGRSS